MHACLLTGESDVLLWDVSSRAHETDKPGGGRGRGSRGLFPGVPGHAGGIAVLEGQASCCHNAEQSLAVQVWTTFSACRKCFI